MDGISKQFLVYDVVGIVLLGVAVSLFFYGTIGLFNDKYAVGIIVFMAAGFIFSRGLSLLKISAAAKATARNSPATTNN